MKYYKRYAGDYIRDTLHLTWLQDCAYNRLLDYQYSTEKKISTAEDAFRIARAYAKEEQKAVSFVYENFFPGGYNPRFQRELKTAELIVKHRKQASRERWKKYNGSNASAMQVHSKCNHSPSSILKYSKIDKSSQDTVRRGGSKTVDDLKNYVLSKCKDPDGALGVALDLIIERAYTSGVNIRSSAYLETSLKNFDFESGQDHEELMQRLRRHRGRDRASTGL